MTPVPAQQRLGPRWYQGSADAIYQSLNLINDQSPDYVVVFGADNIYRMDVDAMLQYHIDSELGCTVAGIRVPRKDASAFGIIDADQNHKITEFLEKPADPPGLPDASDESFASMGNYIFSREALVQALHDDAHSADSRHDMGGDVIPRFVNAADAQVYDFRDNEVPATRRRMPTTGGTWAPSMLTTTRTWIWSQSSRSSTCTTRTGPSGLCRNRLPVPSS
ncbi:glucose-1-phosphate adenylyltransferase [Cutibacterium acnes JCM 18920]|nr:glucose-1-phosphate adenylyltransferase [Cutibacterium acnes JCM 18920]